MCFAFENVPGHRPVLVVFLLYLLACALQYRYLELQACAGRSAIQLFAVFPTWCSTFACQPALQLQGKSMAQLKAIHVLLSRCFADIYRMEESIAPHRVLAMPVPAALS
jgi:hypothetical protein